MSGPPDSLPGMPFGGRNGSFVHFRPMCLMARALMPVQVAGLRAAPTPLQAAETGTE
jgi:hypothetical protein